MQQQDSAEYSAKKRFYSRLLTIYGRKPVLEALQNPNIQVFKLHLAQSNKPSGIVAEIIAAANQRNIEIAEHGRSELSRISKNSKQDQGVALDIECANWQWLDELKLGAPKTLLALDNITNPQNLGMIIRSVSASPCQGLLIPLKGCARLDSLVIKASAGTLFNAPLILCERLDKALAELRKQGFDVYSMEAGAKNQLGRFTPNDKSIYVLGNETHGVSEAVKQQCNRGLSIPMNNQVESLNVAIAASLVAFSPIFN